MVRVSSFLLSFSLLIGLAILLFAAVPVPAQAQSVNRNSITGRITDTGGQALNRMRVELLDDVEMSVRQTYSDTIGRFTFSGLSAGTFNVRVHSDGKYAGRTVRVSLFSGRGGSGSHQEQLDIVLKTINEEKGGNTPINSGTVFAQDVPDNARKVYERALKQLEAKRVDQGVASLKEAIEIFPTYFVALERLGVEHLRREEYDPAREILDRAVKVNPGSAASQYALGVSQYHLRLLAQVIPSLRRSLQLAPGSPNAAFANFYLGLALWKLGKPGDAEPHLKKALELGGNAMPPDIHLHLAKHYSDTSRFREAADELEVFLKLAPDARDAESIRDLVKRLRGKADSVVKNSLASLPERRDLEVGL